MRYQHLHNVKLPLCLIMLHALKMEVSGQCHDLTVLSLGKEPMLWGSEKHLGPASNRTDSLTAQLAASHYTDCGIPASCQYFGTLQKPCLTSVQ
jgi:hypothetical protein